MDWLLDAFLLRLGPGEFFFRYFVFFPLGGERFRRNSLTLSPPPSLSLSLYFSLLTLVSPFPFFLLRNVQILALEKGAKIAAERLSNSRLWRANKLPPLSLPQWLAAPLVVCSSVAYANALFLPPAVEQGIAARVMRTASWVIKLLLRLDLD